MIKINAQFSFPKELRPKGYRGIINTNWTFDPREDLGLQVATIAAKVVDFYITTQDPTVDEVQRQLTFIRERISHLVVEVKDVSGKTTRL